MIVLFTDFGVGSPYLAQLQAVIMQQVPGCDLVSLCADLSPFQVQEAAYLLAAYKDEFPPASVFIGVVDPGVGGKRSGVVLQADERWYVGPDNGLFAVVAARAAQVKWWRITWLPQHLSASFHARDLFAPVAAKILAHALDQVATALESPEFDAADWPKELCKIVYIDYYGNAITGLRATSVKSQAIMKVNGRKLAYARTFCEVDKQQPFWYPNANGLVEFAVNTGSACTALGVHVGSCFSIEDIIIK